ncbi:MAG TPA: SUMF1/EgtB/PvdO family nonheme iron enzyme [Gemmatimonadaceae bacterium]|nr:SUMF1/EgtB/PvdO family nonheme iron enzyme [Gemmatimonadaceae bacterium]
MYDERDGTQRRRLEELLVEAVELPSDARDEFVTRACGDDATLRAELRALLAAHDRVGLLDRPAGRWRALADTSDALLAPGTVIAQRYEIQEKLGAGGMGVVYRARDLRLERPVALKFLPSALGADAVAKRRFLTEARAAAALQHANVCTVHEIGETETGQLFIAMAFVEGESLRAEIERGPLPPSRAADIARQMAAALASAHAHGVVHRDVKPANVMLGADGVAKLVDFGVAKLEGSTLTGTGVTPGTISYMSPEQVRGEDVDHRTDLWALGVVLYEMLTGKRPFVGASDVTIAHAITTSDPVPLRTLDSRIPVALDGIVARALAKDRDRRFQSADEMLAALRSAAGETAGSAPRRSPVSRRTVVVLAVAAAALVVAGVMIWRNLAVQRARDAVPRIAQLAEHGSYVEAYELAVDATRLLPGDSTLRRLIPIIEDRVTIVSNPAGASVWLRRVQDDGSLAPDSTLAGVTPIRDLRLARADYRVDIRRGGFVPVARLASSAFNRAESSLGVRTAVTIEVSLRQPERATDGMVVVPGGRYSLVGQGAPTRDSVTLADFYIDAHEVTNAEFREFVAAGGYSDERYWKHPFVLDGRTLTWHEAVRRLVDHTGLPGPRGWSGQEFPPGEARHPVTGVTWHEAAAYAEFAGKRLPTIFEWEKAARDGRYTHFEHVVMPWGLVEPERGTAQRANFESRGAEVVDSHPSGISPFGAYNMAGNVEEWVANASGDERFVTGGAWDDPMYVFSNFLSLSGFHASTSLGFRCARTASDTTARPTDFEIPPGDATPEYHPVDDPTFRSLLRHYAYDRTPLASRVVARDTTPDWIRETIHIAGPWADPTVIYLYLPVRAQRPVATIVFVPGVNTFFAAAPAEDAERVMGPHVKAGRAVVSVHFKGMVGRPWDPGHVAAAPPSVQYRQELVTHATEMRRAVDYLETRSDVDMTRLAYVGFSKGSGSWLAFAAVEPRFRAVVFVGGGLDEKYVPALPEANSINFAPRISAPTLLLNGRYDEENPWGARALPLWRLLSEPKQLILVEGGHLPPAEVRVPAINRWLDETLGPVR